MGLLSFGAAVAVGVVGTKAYEKYKEKHPDEKPSVNEYIDEVKDMAGGIVDKGLEKIPVVIEKAGDIAYQAKDKVEEYIQSRKD